MRLLSDEEIEELKDKFMFKIGTPCGCAIPPDGICDECKEKSRLIDNMGRLVGEVYKYRKKGK